MAGSEVAANCSLDDVTIFLVEKTSMEEPAGSTGNKRRRTSVDLSPAAQCPLHGNRVGQVKVKASRLRQCSTYFDTCMSERWTQPGVTKKLMEFHLEVHSEVRYYEDCFSRMNYLYKPIRGLACCIGILKVASQIGFQDAIDMGMKYLAAALWSDEEEKLVRDFCDSYLVPLDSLVELIARLDDFPVSEEGKLNKNSLFVRNLLSGYFQCAYPGLIAGSSRADLASTGRCSSCRKKFAGAFHLVVTGSESGVCASVVEHALNLLEEASRTVLSQVKGTFYGVDLRSNLPLASLSIFSRLYAMARKANAAQALAVLILGDDEVSAIMYDAHMNEVDGNARKAVLTWTQMIYSIFRDVLEGTLFLDTTQRVTLFNQWHWVLCGVILEVDEVEVADLTATFLSTLPRQKQAKIWKALRFHSDHGPSLEAYMTWFSLVISGPSNCPRSEERKRRSSRQD